MAVIFILLKHQISLIIYLKLPSAPIAYIVRKELEFVYLFFFFKENLFSGSVLSLYHYFPLLKFAYLPLFPNEYISTSGGKRRTHLK